MSNPSIVIQPFAEPIPLAELKNHLKQDSDTTDDVLIASELTACRDGIETATGSNVKRMRTMMATTFELKLNCFPFGRRINLPRIPLISVTSIIYTDTSEAEQTLSTDIYDVNLQMDSIDLAYGEVWPGTLAQPDCVTIRFVAGIAATFGGENTNTDTMSVYGRTLTDGDRVRLMNSGGGLPTGLAALTDYFVVSASGSTFKLSATAGGAAVDITAVGTGTHYLSQDITAFVTLRNAILLAVGKLYMNRGDGGYVAGGSLDTAQRTIDALVSSQHA